MNAPEIRYAATPREARRVALVTGASSGFGRAIAARLAERGWRTFGTSRSPAPDRDGVEMIPMDVACDASVDAGVSAVLHASGRIDVLVNNAGAGYAGALEDTTIEEARAQFEVNFFGVHRVCRAVLPGMRSRRSGRIVNVSSLGGRVSVPFQGIYCASKFAVEAYTEALRMEVRPFGIGVAMIEPGDYATGFTAQRRMAAGTGPDSAYAERCRRAVEQMARDESANTDLEPVVRRVLAAIDAHDPALRYPVAGVAQRLVCALHPVIPQRWFEALLMRSYGLR
jgi:NAD(P)-dependent dehydrogenase (short-subunit alcohol dehydrogenase family)